MVIKVIERKLQKNLVKETICHCCNNTLEYTSEDVHEYREYDFDLRGDIVYYIECPACFQRTHVTGKV